MAPYTYIAPRIALGSVTNEAVPQLADLHTRIFPVHYDQRFYQDVLRSDELSKIIYYDNQYAGAVCCRLEYSGVESNYSAAIYMMTIGVLKNYRNLGLGSILLEHIIQTASRSINPVITTLYLHVQTTNEAAIRFYGRHGFRIHSVVYDYYKLIDNRDAYILVRPIFPQTIPYINT